ncbi:MAG: hypothetical protein JST36_04360 [Bacteroidetes bacterium]|nr:hypothetical protein [Bacteroidota bacterium]
MVRRVALFALLFLVGAVQESRAQQGPDELSRLLSTDTSIHQHQLTIATFKGVRVINGQSVENEAPGVLNFIILHRFGSVQNAFQDYFGLDNANTRFGFEYGVNPWLTIGVGRSSYQKEYDGLARVKLLRQTMDNHMPISLSYAGTVMVRSDKVELADSTKTYYFSNRMSYCNQLLIARKFSERLSLQLSPTHVHLNLVPDSRDANDVFALGIGGRLKLSNRIALTAEYFYRIPGTELLSSTYYNALSLGLDIETGGHIFQLHFSNSTGMSERTFVTQTADSWSKGGIHLGFNISRVFTIIKPKEFR